MKCIALRVASCITAVESAAFLGTSVVACGKSRALAGSQDLRFRFDFQTCMKSNECAGNLGTVRRAPAPVLPA